MCASAAMATTYYVDSVGGNDNWDGTSPSTPWQSLDKVNTVTFQPGDEILLKAGSVWNGQQLYPKGSGSSGNPIIVDMYDTGNKPQINGDGTYQEAVHLYNQEYWEINNLEVTNYDPAGPAIRQGVRILGEEVGTLHHIHLLNLDVHDVNGDMTTGRDKGKCNAGILIDVVGASTPTKFDDVLVEGCSIHDLSRTALKIWSDWGSFCTNENVTLHTNVVVRNNYVDNYAGDGICPFMTDGAITEYNVSSRGCYELDLANAPIWSWDMVDGVFQYNEVYDTVQTRDGMGFDIDGCCLRCMYQYNYTHDNAGGMIMIIGMPDCAADGQPYVRLPFCNDNVVRYNISQRDEERILRFVGKIWNNYVYNNTIYVGSTNPYIVDSGPCGVPAQEPADTYLYNNIIYNTDSRRAQYSFKGTNYVWDYNLFYGYHHRTEPDDPHKLTDDPLLVNPGGGGYGIDSVDGYKLQSGSPARDSGMTVPDNGGQDYWGNPVPAGTGTDRGAHEYPVGPQPPVADFSGSPKSGPPPLTVNFTDLSANDPTSWDWTFGDGGTSQAEHPSHEYTAENTYTVSLTVANPLGDDTETKPDYITVTTGGGGDYVCTSMTVEVGTLVSGDHTDTHASDDVRVVVDSAKATGKQSVYNVYTFETGLSSLSSLTVTNESQYSNLGSAGYQYRYIELWDYSGSSWVWIERPRIYTAGADVTTVTNVPSPSNYISAGGEVKARFRHGCVSSQAWTLSVDHVKITAQE
jgi:PKD repeat protein